MTCLEPQTPPATESLSCPASDMIDILGLQGGEWEQAAGVPGGDVSESTSPVHRVSFAISMDISALSGTSSNVEIMPMAETLIHPAHAQLRRSSSCIARANTAPWQSDVPDATSAAAREKAAGVCSQTEDGDEESAGPTDRVCSDTESTLGNRMAPLNPPNDGETRQDKHWRITTDKILGEMDGSAGRVEDPPELVYEQSAPGIQDPTYADASATIRTHLAGEVQQTSGHTQCTMVVCPKLIYNTSPKPCEQDDIRLLNASSRGTAHTARISL